MHTNKLLCFYLLLIYNQSIVIKPEMVKIDNETISFTFSIDSTIKLVIKKEYSYIKYNRNNIMHNTNTNGIISNYTWNVMNYYGTFFGKNNILCGYVIIDNNKLIFYKYENNWYYNAILLYNTKYYKIYYIINKEYINMNISELFMKSIKLLKYSISKSMPFNIVVKGMYEGEWKQKDDIEENLIRLRKIVDGKKNLMLNITGIDIYSKYTVINNNTVTDALTYKYGACDSFYTYSILNYTQFVKDNFSKILLHEILHSIGIGHNKGIMNEINSDEEYVCGDAERKFEEFDNRHDNCFNYD